MVDKTAEFGTGFGTTVRAFASNGDEVKYGSWEGGKTLALARSKGFILARTRGSTSAGMHPTTAVAENLRKYLARAAAWTYLVASCTDKAYALIERCKGGLFVAWSILQEKYCATNAEENYPELDQAFGNCKLVRTQKDSEL